MIIHPVPEYVMEQWRALAEQGFDILVGETISRETYEQAVEILENYRSP